MASLRKIEESLSLLAETAWSPRRMVPSSDFVLRPEQLPRPHNVETMTGVVNQLYKHAPRWAPGFDIPYSIPKIIVSSRISSAGLYRADKDGYLFIEIARSLSAHRRRFLQSWRTRPATIFSTCRESAVFR